MIHLFKASIAAVLTLTLAILANAETSPDTPTYLSGMQVCDLTQSKRQQELGFYIQAPLKYSTDGLDLTKKTVSIYAWTLKPFQPDLPSMIYFVGGPGGSAHEFEINLPNWNVVYFDQRGTACSRFDNENDSLNADYYSSEYIARDADLIREHLQIKKWSVYGHSYGTVPATIYAHLFSSSSQALVLEGVIFNGSVELWQAHRRLKILQNLYQHLPDDLKTVVQKISEGPSNQYTFSQITFSFMYMDDSIEQIKNYLFNMKEVYKDVLSKETFGFDIHSDATTLLQSSPNNYTALTCRELSALDQRANFYYRFSGNGFEFNTSLDDLQQRLDGCKKFGLSPEDSRVKIYNALNFSIHIPTTYLQGTTDGATTAGQAVQHFKKVAQSQKQLLIKINGGHKPNLDLISHSTYESQEPEDAKTKLLKQTQTQIFEQALQGNIISIELLKSLNSASSLKWVKTQSH